MAHVFKATKLGWKKEQEGIWFDSSAYTKEKAVAEFKPYEGTTQRGYSYTRMNMMVKNTMMLLT